MSIYIYIYILKKERNALAFFCKRTKRSCVLFPSLQKNVAFFAFCSVLCKRTLRSLRSFPFFRQKRNVLLGLISRQKLDKRTEHYFLRTEKNETYRTEKDVVPNPDIYKYILKKERSLKRMEHSFTFFFMRDLQCLYDL